MQQWLRHSRRQLQVFASAVGLVVLPVFFQAPLVRSFPKVSLALSGFWLFLGVVLMQQKQHKTYWGDLLVGFSWTWLAGSIYWGWLRWEPGIHLPIEALGLPLVGCLLLRGQGRIGGYFYLGSLLGTAVTDLYINWMGLFPAWRQIMVSDPALVPDILHQAATSLNSDIAAGRAIVLVLFLLLAGGIPLILFRQRAWWAFGGAVLSTVVVDGLFFVSAIFA